MLATAEGAALATGSTHAARRRRRGRCLRNAPAHVVAGVRSAPDRRIRTCVVAGDTVIARGCQACELSSSERADDVGCDDAITVREDDAGEESSKIVRTSPDDGSHGTADDTPDRGGGCGDTLGCHLVEQRLGVPVTIVDDAVVEGQQ